MPRTDRALMERAYETIKGRIVSLQFEPGKRLDDTALGVELKLSRTPVREALFRLGAEGFVELRGPQGFIVRHLDLLDIAELFEAHIMIAKAVARLAARRITRPELDALHDAAREVVAAIEARDYLAMASSNARLHRLEAKAAHNSHIQAAANSIHDHGQRLAYLCYGGSGAYRGAALDQHLAKVARDHDEMLTALEAHDADEAERIAVAHVQLFRRRVKDFLDSSLDRDYTITDADFASVAVLRG